MTDRIIGYHYNQNKSRWRPVYESAPGYIVTRAVILCHECNGVISSVGGPQHDTLCLKCWDNQRLSSFVEGKKL